MNAGPIGADTLVELDGISRTFGDFVAVHALAMRIHRGEFLAILGPSGCGKTTLLKLLGGFVRPSSGRILIDGRDVTGEPPERRPTNTVFQGYGLFPHMSVAQNIGYGLRIAGVPRADIESRVSQIMDLVRLDGFGARPVGELSGGQAQRVALARALIMRPEVLMLDEPLAALDLKLRKTMQAELRRIHATTGGTFVFVTHDQEEAMALATRIWVMSGGRIVQDGRPETIYARPCSRFVSSFIGEANVFEGVRRAGAVRLEAGCEFEATGPDGPIACVVRPEHLHVRRAEETPAAAVDLHVRGRVVDSVFLGPFVQITVELDRGGELVRVDSRDIRRHGVLEPGTAVVIGWQRADQHLLEEEVA